MAGGLWAGGWPARIASLLITLWLAAPAAAAAGQGCPPEGAAFSAFYADRAMFDAALAKVGNVEPAAEKLSGITVPHHLLADRLVALGFRAASAHSYRRVVILAPDHFRRSGTAFATTTRGFETVFGPVQVDLAAAAALLGAGAEDSCLFQKEHGVQALVPFIRHYFPEAKVLPVVIAIDSTRADWDRLTEALRPLVDAHTLIVQSTDFSHHMPQHEARRFDQQTLNLLSEGSLDRIAGLHQPGHVDSLGALYVQERLQRELFQAAPLVIASENSQRYETDFVAATTSYHVILYGPQELDVPPGPEERVYYLAGDTNFGRAMKHVLLDPEAAERVAAAVLARTRGRPLIVNLEGVILPNVPEAIDNMTLAMPEDLTVAWLQRLNVAGVGLANNHAHDLGPSGYAETLRALKAAGIPAFGQGEALELRGLAIVGLSDLDTNASRQVDLLTPELVARLAREGSAEPVVAFVHWGREYITAPSPREEGLADAMRLAGATVIAGAHPHAASAGLDALGGGDVLLAYSLGNFLFDQGAERASGALLELRVFAQGTVFARQIPLPNLFDLGRGR